MKPIQITDLSQEQHDELAQLYRSTHDVRLRTRAQMVLLAAEQHLTATEIAAMVHESQGTVRCWLKRYLAEGIEGLHSLVGGRAPGKVTTEYQELFCCSRRCGGILAALGNPTPCGHSSDLSIIWQKKQEFGSRMKRYVSISKRQGSCSVGPSTRSVAQILNIC